MTSAADFRRKVKKIPQDTKIIFDFGDVSYISSAGLREILIYRKSFPDLRIENMQREVFDIFQTTGFDKFIPIALAEEDSQRKILTAEGLTLKKFLHNKANKFGDEVVIVRGGESYTWRDIDRCSTVIAHDLAALNVRQGSHVAICGANSINRLLICAHQACLLRRNVRCD